SVPRNRRARAPAGASRGSAGVRAPAGARRGAVSTERRGVRARPRDISVDPARGAGCGHEALRGHRVAVTWRTLLWIRHRDAETRRTLLWTRHRDTETRRTLLSIRHGVTETRRTLLWTRHGVTETRRARLYIRHRGTETLRRPPRSRHRATKTPSYQRSTCSRSESSDARSKSIEVYDHDS